MFELFYHPIYTYGIDENSTFPRDRYKMTKNYLDKNNLKIPFYIEVRNREELNEVVKHKWINRIILDNMSIIETKESVSFINGRFLIESSGNINESNIIDYAETGVDFVSMGSITHSASIIDMSLIQG